MKIMSWLFYDDEGRIRMVAVLPEGDAELTAQANGLRALAAHGDPEEDFVRGGEVLKRPACPARLVGDELRGLPVPCTILIDDVGYPCDTPDAELVFTQPGEYTVRVQAWPYMDGVFEVTHEPHAD